MANGLQIKLTGDRHLADKLQKMARQYPELSQKAMRDSLLYLQAHTPGYPPAPPNSSYRRTGTLGRSVTSLAANNPDALTRVEPLGGGNIRGLWGTRVVYAPQVIGRGQQRPAFARRWWTLEDVAEKNRPGVINIWVNFLRGLVNL